MDIDTRLSPDILDYQTKYESRNLFAYGKNNLGADQLLGNHTADQQLCFHYIVLSSNNNFPESEISSL